MNVPSYQELMLPALKVLGDGKMLHVRECAKRVADAIGLSPETRDLALPSGGQSYIENRTAWALWYMQQAGLVVRPKRGQYQITEEGKTVLASPPAGIDNKFLSKYPNFVERVLKPRAVNNGEAIATGGGLARNWRRRKRRTSASESRFSNCARL